MSNELNACSKIPIKYINTTVETGQTERYTFHNIKKPLPMFVINWLSNPCKWRPISQMELLERKEGTFFIS